MTEHDTSLGRPESSSAASAGELLLAAREAAGLSIDAVAQQLKLAPRQVRALEEGNYSHLPGRTFTRGFIRNYARLLDLDAEAVLAALPAGRAAPMLESPTLHPTAPTMGELPTSDHSKPSSMRWTIPVTLVIVVAAGVVYEWWLSPSNGRGPGSRDAAPVSSPGAPAASPAVPPPAAAGASEQSGTPLFNPIAVNAAGASAAPPATASPASPPVEQQQIVLTFRDYSWTEVRDRDGRVLLSRMNAAGTTQSISGAPPLELVIGNASDVDLTYKGQPVNLAPSTRQNVARLTLP